MRYVIVITPADECPNDRYLNKYVVPEVAVEWRALGTELLRQDEISQLDVIKADNPNDVKECCSAMLRLWRERHIDASWIQLIKALKGLKLNQIAVKIEKYLKPSTELEEKMANLMHAMEIAPTQQQTQQGKQDQEESSKDTIHTYTIHT